MGEPKDEDSKNWPAWLTPLLGEEFFGGCKIHTNSQRNECNMYCLECMNGPLCPVCLPLHELHHTIQIRRLTYSDVVRVSDINEMVDISGIHTYITNSARVVFLNKRTLKTPAKDGSNLCRVCDRGLPASAQFCSLGCKVAGTSKTTPRKKVQAEMESDAEEESCSTKSTITREEMTNNSSSNVAQTANPSKRKRPRKGTPHRAPLF